MILASITVYQCEDCHIVAVLRHEIEYVTFERTWFNGFKYHFCPVCREKPKAEERILEDEALQRRIGRLARKSEKQKEVEYVN